MFMRLAPGIENEVNFQWFFQVVEKQLADGLTYMGEVNIGESAHGFGKLFYPNGKLMFEGQFFRGKRHGYGRDFYPNGALSYQVPVQSNCFKFVR